MEDMRPRDVVIIGGGLAGAAAAAKLAAQSVDVLLLEKETEAHHKVCGEFISYEAQHYLEQLNVDLAKAQSIERLRLVRGEKSVIQPLGFRALSLSRLALDEAVLLRAASLGAEVQRGVSVTGLVKERSGWRISSNEQSPIIAKTVFLATGKHDLRNWSHRRGQQNDYIGFKMHFVFIAPQLKLIENHVDIILSRGGYAGLEPVEEGKVNLCLVVTKKYYALCGKTWDSLLAELQRQVPVLATCLSGAVPCWDKPLAIFGIPYGFIYAAKKRDPKGLFRLGDQMAVIPSLCGDGMAIALHTAFQAAEYYIKSCAYDYHRDMRRQLKSQIRVATTLSRLLSLPLFQRLALFLSYCLPSVIPNIIRRTRIKAFAKAI